MMPPPTQRASCPQQVRHPAAPARLVTTARRGLEVR